MRGRGQTTRKLWRLLGPPVSRRPVSLSPYFSVAAASLHLSLTPLCCCSQSGSIFLFLSLSLSNNISLLLLSIFLSSCCSTFFSLVALSPSSHPPYLSPFLPSPLPLPIPISPRHHWRHVNRVESSSAMSYPLPVHRHQTHKAITIRISRKAGDIKQHKCS
jgi:hypothetical protein